MRGLLGEALAYLQACLDEPLRGWAPRFALEAVDARGPLAEAVADGTELFRSDAARFRWAPASVAELFARLPLAPTLEAAWAYRVCHALYRREVRELPDVIAAVARRRTGVEIYYSAEIGPGLKIIHGTGTVIGAWCRVGSDFTCYQNVTLGDKLGRDTGKRPVVGDRVIVSTGAQVLGPVEVGERAVVGANAVVLQSLPARCIAVGVPARVVRELSDDEFAVYWDGLKG